MLLLLWPGAEDKDQVFFFIISREIKGTPHKSSLFGAFMKTLATTATVNLKEIHRCSFCLKD